MVVSTRRFSSPPLRSVPIVSAPHAVASCIVVQYREADVGRANLISPGRATDRHKDPDPREVALPGSRPGRVGARVGNPRHLREGRRPAVPRRTRSAESAGVVAEVLR